MRPLFFDFWKDPGSETVDDEMMFGPDYLVAPQLIENATSRSVYLVRTTSDRFPFESSLYLSRACLDKPSLSIIVRTLHSTKPFARTAAAPRDRLAQRVGVSWGRTGGDIVRLAELLHQARVQHECWRHPHHGGDAA